ncbi:formate dehydrogenase accessory protein FdhE [Chloroflexota bacterium]
MTPKANNKILKRLEESGRKRGLSPRFLEFYRRLFRIQDGVEKRIGVVKPSLKREASNSRIEHGLPLISFKELAIDWALLKSTFAEVFATFADYPDLFGKLPKSLREPKPHPSIPKKVVKAWFERAKLPSSIAVDDTNEYLLLEAIIHATLKPFLVSYSKALSSFVNQERWRHQYCPICGGKPDFAFLDKELGARWLLCSRCDTEWLFKRLQCPYCGTQNQDALSYFTDDEGTYRLYVCEQCHKYIKAIDLRHTESEVVWLLERLLTLDMDRQAQEYGYNPYGGDNAELREYKTD